MVSTTTRGGAVEGQHRAGRGQPVQPRHPDVHQDDVRPVRRHRVDRVGAVLGLGRPPRGRRPRTGSSAARPGPAPRRPRSAPASSLRPRRLAIHGGRRRAVASVGATAPPRQVRLHAPAAVRRRPDSSSPPTSSTRSLSPTSPMPRRRAAVSPRTPAAGCAPRRPARHPARRCSRDHGRRRPRVLVHVGQRLLDDPIGGAAQHVRRRRRRSSQVQLDRRPRPPARPRPAGRSRPMPGAGARSDAVRRVVGAQHAEHPAQVLQRLAGGRPDQRGRSAPPARARRRRSPPAPPACSAISETLCASTSCISWAIRCRSPSRAWSARSSRSASARLGPLAQRHHQVAAGADVGADREHRARSTGWTIRMIDDQFTGRR